MIRGLYELVSGEDQFNIACNDFGREQSQQSRAWKYSVNHIYDNVLWIVTNNLNWWYEGGYLRQSMEAIKAKIGGNGQFNTAGFIDCYCLQTDVLGGGSAEGGENAERWDPNIQKAFYNGWKSIHGLKHQTMDVAYGMTVDMYG